QIVLADLAVITKSDVASHAQIQAAREWVAQMNAFADVIVTVQGDLDIALLADATPLTPKSLSRRNGVFSPPAAQSPSDQAEGQPPEEAGGYLGRHRTLHPANVHSFVLTLDTAPLKRQEFDLFMNTLLRLRGADLLRVKGILRFEDTDV